VLFLVYVYRSLRARLRTNVVTVLSIILFVAGSTTGLAVYLDFKRQLVDSTPAENILVLGRGATSEEASRLSLEAAHKIALLPGIRKVDNVPLVTREVVSNVSVNTTDFTRFAPFATVRGIDDQSAAVHGVRLVKGVLPEHGSLQVIVGRRLALKHANLAVGGTLFLPGGESKVSGIFEAGGSRFEDEVWTLREALERHLKTKFSSSVTLVAERADGVPALVAKINSTKELEAQAAPLAAFAEAGAGLGAILRTVLAMLVLLAVVATAAIAATMNAALIARMPELATLAVVGIRRTQLARMVVLESAMLALVGSIIGVLASELVRRQIGMITFGPIPLELTTNATVPLVGLALGLAVGVLGGVAPAIAVLRLDLKTLR
jgi:putative ABC transport system permease protein